MSMKRFDVSFHREDFHEVDFNPDHFLQKYQPTVSLDVLKDDLDTFSKELKSSLVGVINEDYQDFIGLASNLVGLEELSKKLRDPLLKHLEELKDLRSALTETINEVADCKKTQQQIQKQTKLAKCRGEIARICNDSAEAQPTERLVAELAYLRVLAQDFKEELSSGEKKKLAAFETTILKKLSAMLVEALEKQNRDVCNAALNFYSLLDFHKFAEETIRTKFVRPKLETIFDISTFGSEPQELDRFFILLKNTVVTQFSLLLDLSVQHLSVGDSVVGYSILINSLWPELAEKIAGFESLFSTADIEYFQQKYILVMNFLTWYEQLCDSYGSSRSLKTREDYLSLKSRWNYSVYYQARFQEIAGELEMSLVKPFAPAKPSKDGPAFKLAATSCFWSSLLSCWSSTVFISPLMHRFWKLTLQLIARYNTWIRSLIGKDSNLSLENLATLYADIMEVDRNFFSVKNAAVETMGKQVENVKSLLEAAFDEGHSGITSHLSTITNCMTEQLKSQSSSSLESISDIPRLYRRTNKAAPTTPCPYVGNVFDPLVTFRDIYTGFLGERATEMVLKEVLVSLVTSYSSKVRELLDSVAKTEESLRRLRKSREKTPTNPIATGLSDDDKIRQQVALDVERFCSVGKTLSSDVDFSTLASTVEKATG